MILPENLEKIKRKFGIIGNSNYLNRVVEIAAIVANTELSIIITGENGSGKESFSKIIHGLSSRANGKLIAINCGAIPEGTVDSELFGHKKGSFTGALEDRKGHFEEADCGTIFLDEIGELPLSTQARLLRVLEYGEFMRVGTSKVHKVNTRVVAATNVDLNLAIKKGRFREDLFYRLNTVPIHVPPLRDRDNDILLLFGKFANDFADKYHTTPISLDTEAQIVLLQYEFPGNIRQLKNIVEQISILEQTRIITKATLESYLPKLDTAIPALYSAGINNENYEREFLYKIIFQLKNDVELLKNILSKFANFDTTNPSVGNIDKISNELVVAKKNTEAIANSIEDLSKKSLPAPHIVTLNDVDVSIQDKEKELIQKSLQKYNKKNAAASLGISERTLYRKIKEYEIY
jgi:transcriptional regulator with GAF, ATPase, and Fis domain